MKRLNKNLQKSVCLKSSRLFWFVTEDRLFIKAMSLKNLQNFKIVQCNLKQLGLLTWKYQFSHFYGWGCFQIEEWDHKVDLDFDFSKKYTNSISSITVLRFLSPSSHKMFLTLFRKLILIFLAINSILQSQLCLEYLLECFFSRYLPSHPQCRT